MKDTTLLSAAGRHPHGTGVPVNVPVNRASTIVFPTVREYESSHENGGIYDRVLYGALGTANAFALAEAVCALDQGAGTAVTSSGLAACTHAILPFVSQGDHLLVTDSVYAPTRQFCNGFLARFGVETTYYPPGIGTDIANLIRPETRMIFTEAPGSQTFEMQDIPAIVEAAHARDCLVAIDNTWATPLYFKPIVHGVDIAIQAGTKYLSGHSDAVLGVITTRTREQFTRLKDSLIALGEIASPDECYLVLRGMRTMAARMKMQQESALRVTSWLAARPDISEVLYPPLPGAAGHELWKRDFTGAGAVFGIVLPKLSPEQIAAMVDKYELFSIGASWGGYESLVVVSHMHEGRCHPGRKEQDYTLLRYSIGLEDPDELIADLQAGFDRLAACR